MGSLCQGIPGHSEQETCLGKFISCLNAKKLSSADSAICRHWLGMVHTITWGHSLVPHQRKFDIQGQVKRPKFAWQIEHLPCWILAKEL